MLPSKALPHMGASRATRRCSARSRPFASGKDHPFPDPKRAESNWCSHISRPGHSARLVYLPDLMISRCNFGCLFKS